MNYLLDTHSFLWAVFMPEKLGLKARTAITNTGNTIHLSSITFWEISLKYALGKLQLDGCTPETLVSTARDMALTLITPDAEESASFHQLPRLFHRDPFDRMLVWQALRRDLILISKDSALPDYHAMGLKTLW
jgi:PIN domain nuclease of toxin-antitoxin system